MTCGMYWVKETAKGFERVVKGEILSNQYMKVYAMPVYDRSKWHIRIGDKIYEQYAKYKADRLPEYFIVKFEKKGETINC